METGARLRIITDIIILSLLSGVPGFRIGEEIHGRTL